MSELVSLAAIQAASGRIRPIARVTPLLPAPWPSLESAREPAAHDGARPGDAVNAGRPVWLKCENLQPMGAFKIRGAVNMLRQLPREALDRGVITYSSGNHGQAVALAARELDARSVIVMPTTAAKVKVEGAKGYGAEVIFEGTTTVQRQARAEQVAAERGLTMVPPFDHPWIIAGQGTTGLEILEQLPDVGTVYVEVGGGGLLAGTAAALKLQRPDIRVVGVEPDGAAKMSRSLAAGHPITLEKSASIADGLLPVRPGDLTFAHAQAYVDEVVTVPDAAIGRMVAWFFRHARLVVEPSGATAAAAIALGLGAPQGKTVAVVSGGNIEPGLFAELITAR